MPDEPKDQAIGQSHGSAETKEAEVRKAEEGQQLILGRFKSQDELAHSYREIEKAFTQNQQLLAETNRQINELRNAEKKEEPAQNLNELFWQDPVGTLQKVVEQTVGKRIEPLYQDTYESQKENMRTRDPEFVNYERYVDQIVTKFPDLKTERGIVPNLYKMVKGLYFDESAYEKRVREKIETERSNKVAGSIEAGGASNNLSIANINLTQEEKATAVKFYRGVTPEEAYKKYATAKARMEVVNG